MLKLVPLEENLVKAAADEIVAAAHGSDLSGVVLVSPSTRFHHFLRQELAGRFSTPFSPPRLFTVETFVSKLFTDHFPGIVAASETESVYMLFESCRECFGQRMYPSGEIGEDFARFYPRGRQLLEAIEEILTEGGDYSSLDRESYRVFADLGDYHQEYREFIKGLPRLTSLFLKKLEIHGQATRGRCYQAVAGLACSKSLTIPPADSWIFCGFHALNRSEREIMRHFFRQASSCLMLHTDPAALADPLSPFHLQYQTVVDLDLSLPRTEGKEPAWPRMAHRVFLHKAIGREDETIALQRLMDQWLHENKEKDCTHIAVALPDPTALIPFVQNVVSRFDGSERDLAFNITLGYPFARTPLYQLIDAMLRLRENAEADVFCSQDYLALIRHPYIKLLGKGEMGEAPLRMSIHALEKVIADNRMVHFRLPEVLESLRSRRSEIDPFNKDEIESMHRVFVVAETEDAEQMISCLLGAVRELSRQKSSTHVFFPEYLSRATTVLDELLHFCKTHPQAFSGSDIQSISAWIRHVLTGCHIPFEGSPLKGVQVMGMLEFRGLSFAKVAVLDALEGILPSPRKYDPLLPLDIRRLLKIRNHTDWEKLFALHFFSLVASSGEIHLFYPQVSAIGEDRERSRYIERLCFELEKAGSPPAREIPSMWPRYHPFVKPQRRVVKDSLIMETLVGLTFSPSSLDTYIHCPLRFYYERIVGLKEREDGSSEADAGQFGSIVHDILKKLYEPIRCSGKPKKPLQTEVDGAVSESYRLFGFHPDKGLEKVRQWVLKHKLQAFLEKDIRRLEEDNVLILALEKEVRSPFQCESAGREITLEGRIDRIEQEGDTIRVIDYKTGQRFTPSIKPGGYDLKDLFHKPEKEYLETMHAFSDSCRAFQVLAYLLLLGESMGREPEALDAAYIFLKDSEHAFCPVFAKRGKPILLEEKTAILRHFSTDLQEIVVDLFLRDTFIANPSHPHYCEYCPYSALCAAN